MVQIEKHNCAMQAYLNYGLVLVLLKSSKNLLKIFFGPLFLFGSF
jgi:hypothetical protein